MEFDAVIGLEVHCQLATRTKIFCPCPARDLPERSQDGVATKYNERSQDNENSRICPICAGHPGTLPVLNRTALEYAVRAGLATNCKIRQNSVFARKNYFYPDLPKGYQISQYEKPLCEGGWIEIETSTGARKIPIHRIHMEEDAGKNVHYTGYSSVNLNRAGVPLIEIVSGPDMHSSEEAGAYLRALYAIVTYLEICDGNMQEGNFRCDANVSVKPKGEKKLGTRVEIKNVNSFRFIEKAIEYEIARQSEVIRNGEKVVQETRGYDSARNVTTSMRSKEEAMDYRYFPDPDLIPLRLDEKWLSEIKLPELPSQRRSRFVSELGLPPADASVIIASKEFAGFYEKVLDLLGGERKKFAKPAANLVMTELGAILNEGATLASVALKPEHFADTVRLTQSQAISSTGAKQALKAAAADPTLSIAQIVERDGLAQVSDTSALEPAIDQVLAASPAQIAEYQAGKEKVMGFFVGQVMKATGGKANPALLQELIRKKIKGSIR